MSERVVETVIDRCDMDIERVVCGRGRNTTIRESADPCGRLEFDFAAQTAAYVAVGPVRRPQCQRPKRIFRPCSRRVAFGSPPRQILHSTPNQRSPARRSRYRRAYRSISPPPANDPLQKEVQNSVGSKQPISTVERSDVDLKRPLAFSRKTVSPIDPTEFCTPHLCRNDERPRRGGAVRWPCSAPRAPTRCADGWPSPINTRRLNTSSTMARNTNPAQVGMSKRSPNWSSQRPSCLVITKMFRPFS